jgi:hypothetical protein
MGRRVILGAAALALFIGGQAAAQEDLDSGKTPAQLYASNCAICHKTPHGLSKAGGAFGLQSFLREHYTASRQAAAAIAAYVDAVDRGPPPPERGPKRAAKPKEAGKPGDAKASKAKAEPKSDSKNDAKGDSKNDATSDSKSDSKSESKSGSKSESKSEAKGSEPAKPQEKPGDAAPAAPKPDAKPASKPAAESKPDSEKKPN